MDFLQEPTFTAFLALVLSFLVAKIVAFVVSNSAPDADSVVSEGVVKEVSLERELAVRSGKGEKRVKFMDDVVIRRIDRYEGSENLVLLDDVEEKSVDESSGQMVDQFGGDGDYGVRKSEEECYDEREMDDAEVGGSGKTEMLFEEEAGGDRDGVGSENVEALVTSGVKSVSDEREGNEEMVAGDVVLEEEKMRDESDDDWEGVERSELEKCFAEAVNYVECGGKGKEVDRLVRLGSDVQMQLYGLHKIALEGPCLEPQPMALMVSSRTKWVEKLLYVSDGGR
ncbi:acyl-CoA-binding domain-containing protein 3-like isoform X2 [Salvia miltiorrhiza]|uniref:acyl-CoA-binding domain-containing protein 3-like isoform X2 n=1 Tax=Salvia miltiorrhiza TaxID=226208 RepID=UPI0025AC5E7B|nr:acyl-CoA-binding domain-containing protein 3-like isoform X2 [Salvia miltiorrhiza]